MVFNERSLGFFVENSGANTQREIKTPAYGKGNFASGQLVANSGTNFFIVTSPNGVDLNQADAGAALDANDTVIGIGNCYLSDYSVDLSVGSLPTVNVTVEGANMNSVAASPNFQNPAIDQEAGTIYTTSAITLPNPTEDGGITGSAGDTAITALRPGDVTLDLTAIDGVSLVKLDGSDGAQYSKRFYFTASFKNSYR